MKSESWPVVGFYPHVTSTGVFEINLNTLYPNFWSLKEVFSAPNKEIGLYGFISHLAIEVYNCKFWRSPWYSESRIGALYTPKSGKADSSP